MILFPCLFLVIFQSNQHDETIQSKFCNKFLHSFLIYRFQMYRSPGINADSCSHSNWHSMYENMSWIVSGIVMISRYLAVQAFERPTSYVLQLQQWMSNQNAVLKAKWIMQYSIHDICRFNDSILSLKAKDMFSQSLLSVKMTLYVLHSWHGFCHDMKYYVFQMDK